MRIIRLTEVELTAAEEAARDRYEEWLDEGKGTGEAVELVRAVTKDVRDQRFWRWLGSLEVEAPVVDRPGTAAPGYFTSGQQELLADVAYDGPDGSALLEALEELTRDLRTVTYRITGVVTGGGWPEVLFIGDAPEIGVLRSRYEGDAPEGEAPPVWSHAHVTGGDARPTPEDYDEGDPR